MASNSNTKPRILLAEDSQILAQVMALKLSSQFDVKTAPDGESAVKLLHSSEKFGCIVLDLLMPRMDGMEVLRHMRERGDKTPVVVVTARPLEEVQVELKSLDVEFLLSKPVNYGKLLEMVGQAINRGKKDSGGREWVDKESGLKYPFRSVNRFCYICSYTKVTLFTPIPGAYTEDWTAGPYPVFTSGAGFKEWDFLKTWVTVCPYCFFASADPEDFGEREGAVYPYSEDSKKIMARALSQRKKMVPEAIDLDPRFDTPDRNKDAVVSSLILAEKCCNGLVLAGKPGAYVQAGQYSTVLASLHHPRGEKYYRQALMSCENQLKDKNLSRLLLVKTYYFCIVLYMLLGTTSLGRDIMRKLEDMYADRSLDEVNEEERLWLLRINHTWQAGVDVKSGRDIRKAGLH